MCDDQDRFAQRRSRFRSYDTPDAITAYVARLEREWPERATIADYITTQIAQLTQFIAGTPSVLELCCGPGRLAATILDTLPAVHYTGVDLSPPFLAHVQQQLTDHAARSHLHELDLSDEQWPAQLQQVRNTSFHAIVTMQSLHDVGDATVIQRIYQQAKTLLQPAGFLLNADLIVAAGEPLPNNPGRLTIPHHLELLDAAGYIRTRCPLAPGAFGVVMGWVPGDSRQWTVDSGQLYLITDY